MTAESPNRYKTFFMDNISPVFWVEMQSPISISLSSDKQVEAIFDLAVIKDANLAISQMFGVKREKAIGMRLVDTLHASVSIEVDSERYQFYKYFVDSGYNVHLKENASKTVAGQNVWSLISMKGVIENDCLVGYWGSLINITKQKSIQKEIANRTKELERKNKDLEQFNFITTHDLREPLVTITSLVNLLIRRHQDQLNEEGLKSLAFIRSSAQNMTVLVNDLFTYTNLGLKTSFELIDLAEIIKNVRLDLAKILDESDVKISMNASAEVWGLKAELEILLRHLISNAIKFKNQKVQLQIKIDFEKLDNGIKTSIKDNGIGIEKQYQDRIFKIFQRLHTDDVISGTGIGLALCKKIVDLHDGEIWLESELGKGTTFYFTIPNKGNTSSN